MGGSGLAPAALDERPGLHDRVRAAYWAALDGATFSRIALSALDRRYATDWAEMSRYPGLRQYLRRKVARRTGPCGSPTI